MGYEGYWHTTKQQTQPLFAILSVPICCSSSLYVMRNSQKCTSSNFSCYLQSGWHPRKRTTKRTSIAVAIFCTQSSTNLDGLSDWLINRHSGLSVHAAKGDSLWTAWKRRIWMRRKNRWFTASWKFWYRFLMVVSLSSITFSCLGCFLRSLLSPFSWRNR